MKKNPTDPRYIRQITIRETATDLFDIKSVFGVLTPEDATKVIRKAIEAEPMTAGGTKESFWVLHLTSKNNLKSVECCTVGILDAALIHAREVFRGAIAAGAAAIVLAHNHPSGDPSPSAEDIRITRQLVDAGKIIGIKVLDHMIIGDEKSSYSMRENGVADFG